MTVLAVSDLVAYLLIAVYVSFGVLLVGFLMLAVLYSVGEFFDWRYRRRLARRPAGALSVIEPGSRRGRGRW